MPAEEATGEKGEGGKSRGGISQALGRGGKLEEWERQNSPQLSGLGHQDRNSLCFPEAANGSGVEFSWKSGWNLLQNPNKSAGPAVPHLMILKGKCEIVEMLMGLGGAPSKPTRFSQRPQSRGGKYPETSEGCL